MPNVPWTNSNNVCVISLSRLFPFRWYFAQQEIIARYRFKYQTCGFTVCAEQHLVHIEPFFSNQTFKVYTHQDNFLYNENNLVKHLLLFFIMFFFSAGNKVFPKSRMSALYYKLIEHTALSCRRISAKMVLLQLFDLPLNRSSPHCLPLHGMARREWMFSSGLSNM